MQSPIRLRGPSLVADEIEQLGFQPGSHALEAVLSAGPRAALGRLGAEGGILGQPEQRRQSLARVGREQRVVRAEELVVDRGPVEHDGAARRQRPS